MAKGSEIVKLKTNFFKVSMTKSQRHSVTQYHVDFPDNICTPGMKRPLIQQHQRFFGCFIFDGGSTLYLLNPLETRDGKLKLESISRDNRRHILRLRKAREVHFTDSSFLTIFNLLNKDAMRHSDLKLVGRDYYDENAKV
jgi:hypothetical protein